MRIQRPSLRPLSRWFVDFDLINLGTFFADITINKSQTWPITMETHQNKKANWRFQSLAARWRFELCDFPSSIWLNQFSVYVLLFTSCYILFVPCLHSFCILFKPITLLFHKIYISNACSLFLSASRRILKIQKINK